MRWLRASGQPLRSSQTPNRRLQDGPKIPLLCCECEQLFSSWERRFSEEVFIPFHERAADILSYGAWALKFAVSVSWRAFQYFDSLGDFDYLTEGQRRESRLACQYWEEFMLGRRPHPGQYEQHVLAFDVLDEVSGRNWSPFLNRYLLRTVDLDVAAWNHCAMVYTKMGRLILFGFLTAQERRQWVGTRLHVREGQIGAKEYKVPFFALAKINDMAEISAKALASLSPGQSRKLQEAFLNNAGRMRKSEAIRALRQDIRLFGTQAAFQVAEPENHD